MGWVPKWILAVIIVLQVNLLWAEERGVLPHKNFAPMDYLGHFQNWAVVQDHRGVIYVANNHGVIEYDGMGWNTISINDAVARTLDVDETGRVWVGAQDELGYIAADSIGRMVYYSLYHLIADEVKPIGLVRQVYSSPEGIFFSTNNLIFRIKGEKVDYWYPKTFFHRTYRVWGNIYSVQPNVGLTVMDGDTMVLVSGSERFAQSRIYTMLPFQKGQILIGTQAEGFYVLKLNIKGDEKKSVYSATLTPFQTSNDSFFKNFWIYNGVRLANGWYAIATYRKGVVIMDTEGTIIQHINKDHGIQDETVWHVNFDNQDNIWLALNYGISYSALISPITSWDASSEISGVLQSVKRVKENLYVSSNVGVFILKGKTFERVEGILNLSWDIASVKSSDGKTTALVATGDGIYELINGKAKLVEKATDPAFRIIPSSFHKDIVYLGLYEGIGVMEYRQGRWVYLGKLGNVRDRIYAIEEDHKGDIWYSARFKHIGRANIRNPRNLAIDSLTTYVDLPFQPLLDEDTRLDLIENRLMLSTEKGLLYYNRALNKFEPDSSLGSEFTSGSRGIRLFGLDANYSLWFESYDVMHTRRIERAVLNPKGSFIRIPTELNEIPKGIFYDVSTDDDGVSWIAASHGLFRFDPSINRTGRKIPRVLIRNVVGNDGSTLFAGAFPQKCPDGFYNCTGMVQQQENIPELSYSQNSITFHFSSPFFGQESRMLYSYKLDGYEKDWSNWTSKSSKEYTNLPYGSYRFMVKALSIYEVESPVSNFSFVILRPWYHHPMVYLAYVLVLVLLIYGFVAIKTSMLRSSNLRLQKMVEERTKEILKQQKDILEKNEELLQQKEEILSQRDELEHKSKLTKDSLQYAKTIQQAILPEKNALDLYFENFIIFKPKDVVSGDFYWFAHIPIRNNEPEKNIIAVVDCTGHGVPGAFMSMIGSRMLSEIVNERGIHNPASILNELNMMLKLVLHQDSSDNFDGMDISLCAIEKLSQGQYTATFAGANRGLTYYQKDTRSLVTIKGNRKYIGGLMPDIDTEFTNHTIPLKAGDSLFLFTDGITDQNNELGKKFTSPRLESLIMANVKRPMEQLGGIILNTFENHMRDAIQRDDITMIGIRLLSENSPRLLKTK